MVPTMDRDPITKQRSPWQEVMNEELLVQVVAASGSEDVHYYIRRIHDGILRAIRSVDNGLLHLSISWLPHSERQAKRGRLRYPTWDEIADARDVLLPDDIEFVMFLPKAGEYVAHHVNTFHLHEFHG